jgi:hypothetical protein
LLEEIWFSANVLIHSCSYGRITYPPIRSSTECQIHGILSINRENDALKVVQLSDNPLLHLPNKKNPKRCLIQKMPKTPRSNWYLCLVTLKRARATFRLRTHFLEFALSLSSFNIFPSSFSLTGFVKSKSAPEECASCWTLAEPSPVNMMIVEGGILFSRSKARMCRVL